MLQPQSDPSPPPSPATRCFVETCPGPPNWIVTAQWTLFDFEERRVCYAHVRLMQLQYVTKYVDGQPCRELLAWEEWPVIRVDDQGNAY